MLETIPDSITFALAISVIAVWASGIAAYSINKSAVTALVVEFMVAGAIIAALPFIIGMLA